MSLKGKQILVAALNWGLGHASRSMPIIDLLLNQGANILLAGDGRSLDFWKQEYPDLEHVELPSYDVRYTTGAAMVAITLARLPKYLSSVYREHQYVDRLVKERSIDLIISDNRYGIWSSSCPSVFMGHQIALIPPDILKWTTRAVYQLHMAFMNRFDAIWIPDFEGDENLSGVLAHKYALTPKMSFIGPLSRFYTMERTGQEEKDDILVVLSGPEPQRTVLEDAIHAQALKLPFRFTIAQGIPGGHTDKTTKNVRIVSFMNALQLNEAMARAEVVITRSGYSTVMDLCALGKRAMLIPTPGQTEQVYLAEELSRKGMVIYQPQENLNLHQGITQARAINGFPLMGEGQAFKRIVLKSIEKLLSKG